MTIALFIFFNVLPQTNDCLVIAIDGRYALRRPQGAEEKDPEAWDKAIDQAQMVLQHQHARLANLRLLEQFGPGAWLSNNQRLQSVQKQLIPSLSLSSMLSWPSR
jgi:hypothetical protein